MSGLLLVSRYTSEDGRKDAHVYQNPISKESFVRFFHDGKLLSIKHVNEHSVHYAESMAENFVLDVLNLVDLNENT